MNASLLQTDSLTEQVQSLLTAIDRLRAEVDELRQENGELRQQIRELRCDVGYWKSMHARATQRNVKLQVELDQAQAEIRQLKAERFGKRSEKQSAVDRSNQLVDPKNPIGPKNKRGQQPGRPAPKRRDYSHLPVRQETVDLPEDARVCACCGKPFEDLGHNDDSEQIEIETTVYRKVIRRKRYRRTCDCRQRPPTVTAPLPPKLLPKSLYGTSIWMHLVLEKFHLQRPMHRTKRCGKSKMGLWCWRFAGRTCVVTLCESVKVIRNSKRGLCRGSAGSASCIVSTVSVFGMHWGLPSS